MFCLLFVCVLFCFLFCCWLLFVVVVRWLVVWLSSCCVIVVLGEVIGSNGFFLGSERLLKDHMFMIALVILVVLVALLAYNIFVVVRQPSCFLSCIFFVFVFVLHFFCFCKKKEEKQKQSRCHVVLHCHCFLNHYDCYIGCFVFVFLSSKRRTT